MHKRRLATLMGLAGLAPAALAGGCGRSAPQAVPSTTSTTTAAATTTSTTTAAATTTSTTTAAATTSTLPLTPSSRAPRSSPTTGPAPWAPPSPAPTASQAAYELVGAWADHNRKAARADASPGAVAALFAYPYPAGGPQYRGCSTPPGGAPSSCVFRSGNDLLSLTTKAFPNGWGVTSALMES